MIQFIKSKLLLVSGSFFILLTILLGYYIWYSNGVLLTSNIASDQIARIYLENRYKGYLCESLSFAQKDTTIYARIACEKDEKTQAHNSAFSDIAKLTINDRGEITDFFMPDESNYKDSVDSTFPQSVRDEYHRSWTKQVATLNDRIAQRQP